MAAVSGYFHVSVFIFFLGGIFWQFGGIFYNVGHKLLEVKRILFLSLIHICNFL